MEWTAAYSGIIPSSRRDRAARQTLKMNSAPDHVQFGFFAGARLKDPKGLLRGEGKFHAAHPARENLRNRRAGVSRVAQAGGAVAPVISCAPRQARQGRARAGAGTTAR